MSSFKIAAIFLLISSSIAIAGSLPLLWAGSGTGAPPPNVGALLLEDGSSFFLLEDNASKLCLEGGTC
jgi:hypothetical protein